MKTISSVSRILLGVVFTIFGLNGFLHFIPMGPPRAASPENTSARWQRRTTWPSCLHLK